MPKIRKIIKKKKKNEAKEALAKASGGEELEIAAKILGELRERNKRKRKTGIYTVFLVVHCAPVFVLSSSPSSCVFVF